MAWLGLVFTAVQAYNQAEMGRANAANARIQAIQDQRDANMAQVQGQTEAFNERRRAKILRSRALAVAGASGAGMSEDPGVANILGQIGSEGEYRALSALAEGDYQAQALRSGAQSKLNMSKAYRTSGYLSAAGTLAQGVYSFYDKYGGDWMNSYRAANLQPVTTTASRITPVDTGIGTTTYWGD
jgi:hypothetical protein